MRVWAFAGVNFLNHVEIGGRIVGNVLRHQIVPIPELVGSAVRLRVYYRYYWTSWYAGFDWRHRTIHWNRRRRWWRGISWGWGRWRSITNTRSWYPSLYWQQYLFSIDAPISLAPVAYGIAKC